MPVADKTAIGKTAPDTSSNCIFFTGRAILFFGVRQLLIGFTATGVTYGIGHLIGVAIAG